MQIKEIKERSAFMSEDILKGRTVIVTGASSGIGAEAACAFAAKGASVVLAARRKDRLQEGVRRITQAGGKALAVPADVTREEDVVSLFAETAKRFGPVDVLISNAGVTHLTPTDEMSLKEWRDVIDANLTSAFLCSREALRAMKPRKRGRILLIGSVSAKMPRPDTAAYAASKAALAGLAHSLALDGRPFGIGVSIVHPGITRTELAGPDAKAPAWAMEAEDIVRILLLMASLPDGANMLDATALPIAQPYLGRG